MVLLSHIEVPTTLELYSSFKNHGKVKMYHCYQSNIDNCDHIDNCVHTDGDTRITICNEYTCVYDISKRKILYKGPSTSIAIIDGHIITYDKDTQQLKFNNDQLRLRMNKYLVSEGRNSCSGVKVAEKAHDPLYAIYKLKDPRYVLVSNNIFSKFTPATSRCCNNCKCSDDNSEPKRVYKTKHFVVDLESNKIVLNVLQYGSPSEVDTRHSKFLIMKNGDEVQFYDYKKGLLIAAYEINRSWIKDDDEMEYNSVDNDLIVMITHNKLLYMDAEQLEYNYKCKESRGMVGDVVNSCYDDDTTLEDDMIRFNEDTYANHSVDQQTICNKNAHPSCVDPDVDEANELATERKEYMNKILCGACDEPPMINLDSFGCYDIYNKEDNEAYIHHEPLINSEVNNDYISSMERLNAKNDKEMTKEEIKEIMNSLITTSHRSNIFRDEKVNDLIDTKYNEPDSYVNECDVNDEFASDREAYMNKVHHGAYCESDEEESNEEESNEELKEGSDDSFCDINESNSYEEKDEDFPEYKNYLEDDQPSSKDIDDDFCELEREDNHEELYEEINNYVKNIESIIKRMKESKASK